MKLSQYNFVTKIQIVMRRWWPPDEDIIKLIKCLNAFDMIWVRLFKHYKVYKQYASFGQRQKMYPFTNLHVNVVICTQHN